jgi:hypothetical protein
MKLLNQVRLIYVLLFLLGLSLSTSTAFAIPEIEGNDLFSLRQLLPFGTSVVEGELSSFNPMDFDFSFSSTLAFGTVHPFEIAGLTPSDPFIAWTDNDVGGPNPDTILGTFEDAGFTTLIDVNDDSSPVGDGLASGLDGSVNPDGTIRLGVTGFDDFGFIGNHFEAGPYDLFVRLGNTTFGDLDFFSFSGLVPGSPFTAEITLGTFDSMLGWLDDSGNIILVNDNGGEGLLSLVDGIVPASGQLNLAVTAFADFSLVGDHGDFGDYTLSLDAQVVPEPSTILLMGCGLFGLLGISLRRRRRKQS